MKQGSAILKPVYSDGAFERIQGLIDENDFKLLFRKVYWVRGSQNQLIGRMCKILATLLREAGFDRVDDVNDVEARNFLNSIQVSAKTQTHGRTIATYDPRTTTVTTTSSTSES